MAFLQQAAVHVGPPFFSVESWDTVIFCLCISLSLSFPIREKGMMLAPAFLRGSER